MGHGKNANLSLVGTASFPMVKDCVLHQKHFTVNINICNGLAGYWHTCPKLVLVPVKKGWEGFVNQFSLTENKKISQAQNQKRKVSENTPNFLFNI